MDLQEMTGEKLEKQFSSTFLHHFIPFLQYISLYRRCFQNDDTDDMWLWIGIGWRSVSSLMHLLWKIHRKYSIPVHSLSGAYSDWNKFSPFHAQETSVMKPILHNCSISCSASKLHNLRCLWEPVRISWGYSTFFSLENNCWWYSWLLQKIDAGSDGNVIWSSSFHHMGESYRWALFISAGAVLRWFDCFGMKRNTFSLSF